MTEETRSAGEFAEGGPVRGWRAVFPPAQWLAAYGIPVSLAYASLAGLPPQYGIYCYLVGGLFYALFGSSRQLAIGPTSAISMLVGVTVAGMAQGDPGRWADIAALTALVMAAMCVLAWLLLGEKLLPGLPVALFVVVISIIVLSVTPLADLGFNVVGALPPCY